MFENPHGLDELGEDDKAQLKLLYTVRFIKISLNHILEQKIQVMRG